MLFLILAFIWLLIAFGFSYVISYSHKVKNVARLGIGVILFSFCMGIIILLLAIASI